MRTIKVALTAAELRKLVFDYDSAIACCERKHRDVWSPTIEFRTHTSKMRLRVEELRKFLPPKRIKK